MIASCRRPLRPVEVATKTLKMTHVPMTKRQMDKFALGFYQNPSVVNLEFVHSRLDQSNMGILSQSLRERPRSLRKLVLDHNHICPAAARQLKAYLIHAYMLEVLSLKGNPLGDEGIQIIAEVLEHTHHLRQLDLANTKMESAGAFVLIESLRKLCNTSMVVDVSDNMIGPSAQEALEECARTTGHRFKYFVS